MTKNGVLARKLYKLPSQISEDLNSIHQKKNPGLRGNPC